MIVLTGPRFRVMISTKCEENMTMKYRIASAAMVPMIVRTLSPRTLSLVAKNVIVKNARESGACT